MSKKILFIEDESALQKTMGDFLEQNNYEIIHALNGEIGLKMANPPDGKKPDLILLDLILPKVDGFEVLKRLKAAEETKAIPVIILTNLEQMQDIEKVIGLGAVTYLVKANYSLKEVLQKIESAIEKKVE